jgi:hypothetical protein
MQSPYAYGDLHDPHLHMGIKTNPRMHTGFTCLAIRDPRMHTGIDLDPRMHTGIACHVIPVCIRGFAQSTYAYGDHGDPSMHMGIA